MNSQLALVTAVLVAMALPGSEAKAERSKKGAKVSEACTKPSSTKSNLLRKLFDE
jgi:hypothetical protein